MSTLRIIIYTLVGILCMVTLFLVNVNAAPIDTFPSLQNVTTLGTATCGSNPVGIWSIPVDESRW
jgi:hypothetical protein